VKKIITGRILKNLMNYSYGIYQNNSENKTSADNRNGENYRAYTPVGGAMA
jgi:hypothetical protein